MKLPTEMELWHEDTMFRVRFDYNPGEMQWFDARSGVGSPGYDPSVSINEVNFGSGWESPDVYPQLNIESCESKVMERLAEIESEANAERDEREAEYWADQRRIEK